jgi:hypothetical protein
MGFKLDGQGLPPFHSEKKKKNFLLLFRRGWKKNRRQVF